jgi:hypothetical protein
MFSVFVFAASAGLAFAPCPTGQAPAPESDLFSNDQPLSEAAMSEASGGEAAAIDISELGLNVSSSNGTVTGVTVDNSDTGAIANTTVTGNSGITAVFNNTGNGVIFQNTLQVNVFLNAPQ